MKSLFSVIYADGDIGVFQATEEELKAQALSFADASKVKGHTVLYFVRLGEWQSTEKPTQ